MLKLSKREPRNFQRPPAQCSYWQYVPIDRFRLTIRPLSDGPLTRDTLSIYAAGTRCRRAAANPATPTAAPVVTADANVSVPQSMVRAMQTNALTVPVTSRGATYGTYRTRRLRSNESLCGERNVTHNESSLEPIAFDHLTSCAKCPPVEATSRWRPDVSCVTAISSSQRVAQLDGRLSKVIPCLNLWTLRSCGRIRGSPSQLPPKSMRPGSFGHRLLRRSARLP